MGATMQRRRLLILENDRALRRELEAVFSDLDVTACETSDQTLATVRRTEPDAVLFDLGPAREPAVAKQSLELLRQILNISPDTKIIAMTEHDARELAVAAVGLGATDFYHKPLDAGVLSIVVRRALRIRELEEENWQLRERTGAMALEGIIGASDAMRSICRAIEKVAPTNATVLLLGDSGTGKELLARAVHRLSGRSHKPFVAINCAAIPDTLLESELFGYEKGAFTGANRRTAGKLESADGGTVFLDEIGDMSMALQAKLLRVIEDQVIRPVGSTKGTKVDIRLISATNKDLKAAVRAGTFREDLYYRINVIALRIPPLRERQEDIEELVRYYLRQYANDMGKATKGISSEALEVLKNYEWAGNVRELQNVMERAILISDGDLIKPEHLPGNLKDQASFHHQAFDQKLSIEDYTKSFIIRYQMEYNEQQLADMLGITRKSLWEKRKKWGIPKER